MAEKETIFLHGINSLKVDENGHLYWNDKPVLTDVKISSWVNFAIILAGFSTAVYALVTLLAYLKINVINIVVARVMALQTILTIASGTCFLVGVFFLAYTVEFPWEKKAKDNEELQQQIEDKGGHAKLNHKRLRTGLILSCIGYVLLLISTAF